MYSQSKHYHSLYKFFSSSSISNQQNRRESFLNYQKHISQIISLIKSSCIQKSQLIQLHAHLVSSSLIQDPNVSLALLSRLALSPFRDLTYSRRLFDHVPKLNISHYSTMIRACSTGSNPAEGFNLYRDMLRRGIRPDPISSMFVAKSCIKTSSLVGGLQIHARVLRDGNQWDSLLLTTLTEFYSNCQRCDDARKVFDEMSQRDTVAWNVLISCYTRNGRTKDALGIFDTMQSPHYGSKPDDVTCLLLLQACSNLGAVEFGERIHKYILENGYASALNLSNTLVAMYSKCGCMDKAYNVFKSMPRTDVVSWSAMICGFASNGCGSQAIEAFKEMQRMGIAPDEQTFTGVLSACSHSGLLDEGRMFFNSMRKEFGIAPNIHHYGCVVDLMGRAGLLNEAYELIISMKVKPDPTIWRTLLGACRIHNHVDLGERVKSHLIEHKALESGDYVLLLNMYSSVGDWDKVTEIRKFMKDNAIQTTPGCSTMVLNGVVHEFLVDDISHPRTNEIYKMLDEIWKQLKIGGYVAEITSELHNLEMNEKEIVLSYHSEKLAIAFGVLTTPPGTAIRIAKNIRTCVDCHNFAKVFSRVYDREVIIRDRNRFHHFREGHCNCNDYW